MQQYIFPIQSAFLMFPFLAALFSLPFLLVQYHRYGAVPMIRAMVVYSFILYLFCSYFLVILPLPDIAEVAKRTNPYINLAPYKSMLNHLKQIGFDPTQAESWKQFYNSTVCREPALNILLTIPFGVYLRYYFRRKWWQSVGLGFGLSLFFELTQLSGLYGIYPRPYRLFDVTDLMNNTLGTLIGFWIAPLLIFFLPSKHKLEEVAYQRGTRISALRRTMAFLVDWAIVGIVLTSSLLFGALAPFWLCGPIYFAFVPFFSKGYTIGSYLCSFRITDKHQNQPALWQCLIRAAALYLPFASTVSLWVIEAKIRGKVPSIILETVVNIGNITEFLTFISLMALVWQSICKLFNKEKLYFYETMSHTYLISTVNPKQPPDKATKTGTDRKH